MAFLLDLSLKVSLANLALKINDQSSFLISNELPENDMALIFG